MEASARVPLKGDPGGVSVPHKPRYRLCQHSICPGIDSHTSAVYYRINKGGVIAIKMSFDADDESLGRVDTLSVTPPHKAVAQLSLPSGSVLRTQKAS